MNKQYLIKIIKEELGMYLSEAKLSTANATATSQSTTQAITKVIVDVFAGAAGEAGVYARNAGAAGAAFNIPAGKAPRVYRRIYSELKNKNLLQKFKTLVSPRNRPDAARYLIRKISNGLVQKSIVKVLPPLAIAWEIYEMVDLWNKEGAGIDIWDPTSFGFKHALSKGDTIAYGGKKRNFKPGDESGSIKDFDSWPADIKDDFCYKNTDHEKCKLHIFQAQKKQD